MNLDISSEIIEPVKPTTAEYANRLPVPPRLLMPKTAKTMLITTKTAILVAKNRKIRFTDVPFGRV